MKRELFHLASVLVLWMALVVVLIVADRQLEMKESAARQGLVVVAYLANTFEDAKGPLFADEVVKKSSDILQSRFQSKAQALQIAQSNPAWAKALLLLKANPLPSSLSITLTDRAWIETDDPSQILREIPEVAEVRWDPALRDTFREANRWRRRITGGYVALAGFLLLWTSILLLLKKRLRKEPISG